MHFSFSGIVKFLNSALGLWLLSSVVISGGAWVFQEWRDSRQQEISRELKYERLLLEAAGRTSQFQSWLSHEIFDESYTEFRSGTTAQRLRSAILIFAGPPKPSGSIVIYEVLPEFKDSSLYSIYSQLQSLGEAELQAFIADNGLEQDDEQRIAENRLSEPARKELQSLRQRAETFRLAMIALNEPDYLTEYRPLDVEIYKTKFFETFVDTGIAKFNFPYSDCWC